MAAPLPKAFCSWSGGKDSALALYMVQQAANFSVETLLTNITREHERVSMHGVRLALIQQQAAAIGKPVQLVRLPFQPSGAAYQNATDEVLHTLANAGYTHGIFGDIFLEDLRQFRVQQLARFGMTAVFPLWGLASRTVLQQLFDAGFKMITVCADARLLSQSFVGRIVDADFIQSLLPQVDACGENGEYHSFVFDGPMFTWPVRFTTGQVQLQAYSAPKISGGDITNQATTMGFWHCDIVPIV